MKHHQHNHEHHALPEKPSGSRAGLDVTFDPGMKELADALQKMFFILKVVIVLVIGWLIWSGVYRVEENEQAVELRFGKVKGVGQKAILVPGLHWAWPKPIEEVIKIPADNVFRQLPVDAFWYYQDEKAKAGVRDIYPGATLQFVRDGYSLTASKGAAQVLDQTSAEAIRSGIEAPMTDYNLVHTRWSIRYWVAQPLAFVENLWDGTEGDPWRGTGWLAVEEFLRSTLCEAVIVTSAKWDVNMIIWEEPKQFRSEVEWRFVKKLKQLNVGLDAKLEFVEQIPPRQVKPYFDEAASAGIEAEKLIKAGLASANEIRSQSQAQATEIVAKARGYQQMVIEAAKADSKYLNEVLQKIDARVDAAMAEGPQDPTKRRELRQAMLAQTVDQLYHEMLRDVLDKADEAFVLAAPENADVEWRPILNRDASISKKKSDAKKQQQQYMNSMQSP